MKKRILSLLLCLVMVVGLLPVTALAENVNMSTYTGNRITEIVIKASVDTSKVPDATNSYTESRNFVVGEPVVDVKFKFEVERLNYKTSTGTTGTETDNFPISIGFGPYYYDANNKKWGSVISYVMPYYLAGQYRYNVSAYVEDKSNLDNWRIDPNVKVTINWSGSDMAEDCTENFWACNEDTRSLVTAKTVPFTITGDGPLKLTSSGISIPSGYANEEIKSFSVASWASGGTQPYTFSKENGPAWITVDPNGTVHGTPTTVAEATTLKIKVTDTNGNSTTADITVGAVKAARTVINTIKIAGLSYPRVGDVVPEFPGVYVTEINGGAVSLENSPIRLAMRFWKDDEGNHIYNAQKDAPNTPHAFIVGEKYVFNMQVRLEGEDICEKYRLDENLQVIVPSFTGGAEGHNTLKKTTKTRLIEEADYAYLSVSSPEWVPVDTGNTLTGTISYSGAARYGQKLTANVTDCNVELGDLSYQWQYKAENGIWYDVYDNGRSGSITLNEALGVDKLAGCDIRVTVRCTGNNYAGTLFGASKKVTKDVAPGAPAVTQLTVTTGTDSKATVTIGNYYEAVKYVYTTTPVTSGWPTGTAIAGSSFTVEMTGDPQTIYVYAWYKETDTQEAGVYYSGASALIPGTTTSEYARDMVYPDYDSKTPTIYLKKGEQITVKYQFDPNNATANLPQWKGTYTATDSTGASVEVTNDPATKTLTIKAGDKTGTVDVVAYKDASVTYPDRWQYGSDHSADGRQITVKIYDPNDLANVPFTKTYFGTTELYVDDTYEITKAALRALPFAPDGVNKDGYTLAAKFTTYGTGGDSGSITRSDTNDYVSLSSDAEKFVIKGKAVTDSSVYVEFFALPNGTAVAETAYGSYAIAALNVTVKARPTVLDLSITPPVLTLQAGKTYQLVATKTPAASDDTFTWSSDRPDVVTVTSDANDSSKATVEAMATATAGTTATITAKYEDGTTALTANCIITVTAACGDSHAYVLYQEQDWGHKRVCLFCGEDEKKEDGTTKVEPHDFYESAEDTNVLLCSYCDYSAKLTADTTDETVTPSSPSGGHHGGAGRPYRPGLSTAAPGGTTTAAVQSPKTGDAGIMLYAALSLMSMTGGAWLVSKKRRDR